MKSNQIQNYQMLARVAEYTADSVSLFPKTSAIGEILEGLKSAVKEMSNQASAQVSSEGTMRESRAARTAARQSLTRRLALTAQVAQAMNSEKFQMPDRQRDHDLISAGHAFVEDGASLGKEFSRHALPLAELSADVEALERANFAYSAGKAERTSAIREFTFTTKEAMGYLHRLDALVEMTLSDNPAAVASWTVARTVIRTPARKRAVTPPGPVTPPAPEPTVNPVPLVTSAAA